MSETLLSANLDIPTFVENSRIITESTFANIDEWTDFLLKDKNEKVSRAFTKIKKNNFVMSLAKYK